MSLVRRLAYEGVLYWANRVIARTPSHAIRLAFYRNILGVKIGQGTYILMDAWFDTKGGIEIGAHSVINQKCRLDGRGGITMGSNVSLSAEVTILTADHDIQSPSFAGREKPVVIGDRVFVGTRAMILPGVTLGEGAVVAAGAIVTKDVAPYTIVAGIPAKPIGERSRDLTYTLDYGRLLW
jgi:acetyltransferase-like isoleucine patch superfamily enzyme